MQPTNPQNDDSVFYQEKKDKLASLASTYAKRKHRSDFLDFRAEIWQYMKLAVVDKKPLDRDVVLDNIPLLCLGHRDFDIELTVTLSNLMIDIMLDPEALKHVLNHPAGEEALAWFCTDHSTMYTWQANDSHIQEFKEILNVWTGCYVEGTPELDKIVTLFYGPPCWDLYGTPLEGDATDYIKVKNLVYDLSVMNAPLCFKKHSVTPSEKNINLPSDLDI